MGHKLEEVRHRPFGGSAPGRAEYTLGDVTALRDLAVATVGLGLNLRAWILLGPLLAQRPDVEMAEYVLLAGVPLLVAAVLRLPVGVLTDRYGARVMFPAVSLVAAGSVTVLALADAVPVLAVAGAAAGVAGTAFVVGAGLVARVVGYGRRGLALGVFTLGSALAVLVSVWSWQVDPAGRRPAAVLAGALVGFAALAALVLRGDTGGNHGAPPLRRCVEMVRLAADTSLSLLYAVALGGVMAIAVYLPVYLTAVFGLPRWRALMVTGAVVALAALARLAGGWWTDRRPSARLLTACYAVAAGLCLAVAVAPRLWWLSVPLIAATAVCDGVAGGALLALIGKAVRADSAGAVMGVTGAAAAVGAVVLSLAVAGADRLSRTHAAGWLVLGAVLLGVALYVRANGLRVGLGLAVQPEPVPSPMAMTVAVVNEADTRWGAAAVVARLAELAVSDELVVVYGSDPAAVPRPSADVLVAGLRDRLPRHSVVALPVGLRTGSVGQRAALFGEFVESGGVAIAVTPTVELSGVTAQLSSYLQADRVLLVSYTRTAGADVHRVWDRGDR
jgi:MFS transporter, NNP family, nitrate/nitrite transporter